MTLIHLVTFQGYAPTEDHPFYEFLAELTELVDLMEKLHDHIEDEGNEVKAVGKVLNSLKSHMIKSGKVKTVAVNKAYETTHEFIKSIAFAVKTNTGSSSAVTPKKDVGSGGSMAGRRSIKVS